MDDQPGRAHCSPGLFVGIHGDWSRMTTGDFVGSLRMRTSDFPGSSRMRTSDFPGSSRITTSDFLGSLRIRTSDFLGSSRITTSDFLRERTTCNQKSRHNLRATEGPPLPSRGTRSTPEIQPRGSAGEVLRSARWRKRRGRIRAAPPSGSQSGVEVSNPFQRTGSSVPGHPHHVGAPAKPHLVPHEAGRGKFAETRRRHPS